MIDYRAIGKRVTSNREKQGITQEYLAEKINVSIPHISRIENGTSKPSLQVLVNICNVLNITIDDLMQDSLAAVKQKRTEHLEGILADCTIDELSMIANLAKTVLHDARQIYTK